MTVFGFTGTDRGMTQWQRVEVGQLLLARGKPRTEDAFLGEFHHGDCIGADDEAAAIAMNLFYRVVSHPPVNPAKRAYADSHEVLDELPYLERDMVIATVCDELIATPKKFVEEQRSGTWATVRYARAQGKRVTVIYPDGTKEVTP